ncbi:MAG: 4-alpha-glucanotransferase [Gammaproteobacteria bacterium]|nr:4-alpha-glucanotransferase [Gammaproteobacteria bacterium]MBU1654603.1 4-alpha-glucanotransferase [Gammaproteobacteria bacterium]MBU1962331.1 4-alpha-glucanotransferase [Gammaproteobacteria bacterium]
MRDLPLPPRQAGVLLHLTSLPGLGRQGRLGADAFRFVDFLAASGFSVWQMLPINPVGLGGSPYQTSSAFAGDQTLIDPVPLMERGWLPKQAAMGQVGYDDFRAALRGFCLHSEGVERQAFIEFVEREAYWLDDYALFHVLHQELGCGWWEWPDELRDRTPQSLSQARARLADRITCYRFQQFLFFEQWRALKKYANERGILLFGDVPIFVAHDSAEVWAHRELFEVDEYGHPTIVAGVPPDYFSATGQRWGNPLYRWEVMHQNGYRFWEQRINTQLELFDLIRIDHFRGFESYWAIPAHEQYAINGCWLPGPGNALFDRLREKLGRLPLVAEDLGIITDEVRALKERQGLPGMKILQFAFSGGADNPYLPYNHERRSVVYTGTHDNDTTLGWYNGLDEATRRRLYDYLGNPAEPMPWPLIRSALASRSQLAMLPMQDLLGLDGNHRMNTPGTNGGDNWRWRFTWEQTPTDLAARLRGLLSLYGRLN